MANIPTPDGSTPHASVPDVPPPESAGASNVVALACSPESQLRLALRRLETALAEQNAAIRCWRDSLGDLGTSMRSLATSVSDYQARLDVLQGEVAGAHATALEADAAADVLMAVATRAGQDTLPAGTLPSRADA